MEAKLYILANTSLHISRPNVYIEGIHVDALFDEIHRRIETQSKALGIPVRFELIAWEPITVAADGKALVELIVDLLRQGIEASSEGSGITVRAFSSHDDICATFEIVDQRLQMNEIDNTQDLERSVTGPRALIQRMGGELNAQIRPQGGVRVTFWLPQWISSDLENESVWRQAA